MANRIDVHHHLVPPFWAEALSRHGGNPSGWNSPAWSPAASLAFMDAQRITTAVLSLTAPGVTGWVGEGRREMARRVNEFGAELVARSPYRFGNFATLPLPDLEGRCANLNMHSTHFAPMAWSCSATTPATIWATPPLARCGQSLIGARPSFSSTPPSRKFLSLRISPDPSSTIRSIRRAPPCSWYSTAWWHAARGLRSFCLTRVVSCLTPPTVLPSSRQQRGRTCRRHPNLSRASGPFTSIPRCHQARRRFSAYRASRGLGTSFTAVTSPMRRHPSARPSPRSSMLSIFRGIPVVAGSTMATRGKSSARFREAVAA